MDAQIGESRPHGVVQPPGSKSYTIRAVACAALADGRSTLEGALDSEDSSAVKACARALGAAIRESDATLEIEGVGSLPQSTELQCGESGATFRFLLAVAAARPVRTILHCAPSLARRPVRTLLSSLESLGAVCELDERTGSVSVIGTTKPGGQVSLKGGISSQFLSGLLLSGPLYPEGLEVRLDVPTVSERYVAMTMRCMRAFGAEVTVSEGRRRYTVSPKRYRANRYAIEADWSAAAPLLALGAISGDVTVEGLHPDSLQADVRALSLLRSAGADVRPSSRGFRAVKGALNEFEVHLDDAIDLLPIAGVLGAVAPGMSELRGIQRARDKESDRVAAMVDGLRKCSVAARADQDQMTIAGGFARGGHVSAFNDHRIAMAFGVLGTATGDMRVQGAECVSKTYPHFWDDLKSLGVEVELHE